MHPTGSIRTSDYLKRIGVADMAPATSPFDPGTIPAPSQAICNKVLI